MMMDSLSDTWIMDLSSQIWMQYTPNQDHGGHLHKGSLGVKKCIFINGGFDCKSTDQTYTPTFHAMLEPKCLQQVAMKIIHSNQYVLPWKRLPSKLIAQLGLWRPNE